MQRRLDKLELLEGVVCGIIAIVAAFACVGAVVIPLLQGQAHGWHLASLVVVGLCAAVASALTGYSSWDTLRIWLADVRDVLKFKKAVGCWPPLNDQQSGRAAEAYHRLKRLIADVAFHHAQMNAYNPDDTRHLNYFTLYALLEQSQRKFHAALEACTEMGLVDTQSRIRYLDQIGAALDGTSPRGDRSAA